MNKQLKTANELASLIRKDMVDAPPDLQLTIALEVGKTWGVTVGSAAAPGDLLKADVMAKTIATRLRAQYDLKL
jgi:hypothetical protein